MTGPNALTTRRFQLRPVAAADYQPLLELETAPDVLSSWRLRGARPNSLAQYEQSLWLAVTDQKVIEDRRSGEAIGLVQLYNTDFRLGTGWFSVIAVPEVRATGRSMEGLGLFLRHCFTTWSLRRLYFASLAPNFSAFASLTKRPGCSVYGTLHNRTVLNGERVDVIVGGVDAGPWLAHYGPVLHRLTDRSGQTDQVRRIRSESEHLQVVSHHVNDDVG
jgi:RimJ/RimL family protein N-acetyltransferase